MALPETRISLLTRLNDNADVAAWSEFCEIYERAIYGIAKKYGLQDADAREVSQDVLLIRQESARSQEALLDEKLAEIETQFKAGLVQRSAMLEVQQESISARERSQSTAIEIQLLKSQLDWMQQTANLEDAKPSETDALPARSDESPRSEK